MVLIKRRSVPGEFTGLSDRASQLSCSLGNILAQRPIYVFVARHAPEQQSLELTYFWYMAFAEYVR